MSDIAAPTRALLAQHFDISYGSVAQDSLSTDGTRKLLVDLRKGKSRTGRDAAGWT